MSRPDTPTRARHSPAPANGWGGARVGAGRPARRRIASEPHKVRPPLAGRHPVHVTARLHVSKLACASTSNATRANTSNATRASTSNPTRASTSNPTSASTSRSLIHRALERALRVSLARDDFRIVHLGLVRDRVELVVEAESRVALARGMQGFQVSLARTLNRLARRHGNVFPDRYRMRILHTRVAVRDVVGGLPLLRTAAWPQTWLLRLDLARVSARVTRAFVRRDRRPTAHRAWRSRADEDA